MWVFGMIRESMGSFPLEVSRYIGKTEEEIFLSSKAGLSCNLHNNILTPDKIPEFSLPPRLCKRSPLLEADTAAPNLNDPKQPRSGASSSATNEAKNVKMKSGEPLVVARRAVRKPLPFSAESFGLAGMYESPNTRRKESLFHSKRPAYILDRSGKSAALRQAKEPNLPKKTLSGMLYKQLQKTESRESIATSSSSLSSQCHVKSSPNMPSHSGRLRGATSCPSLIDSRERRDGGKMACLTLTTSPSCPPSLEGSLLTLGPPVLFPLDVLQSPDRAQQEQILSLQGRVKVRLFAEQTVSTNMFSALSTVRVRVVSVEGLCEDAERRSLDYAVTLCLTPGKLQPQQSATIRNCSRPVFNEDFFFTELSREDLLELQLRLRVVNKLAAGPLRRVKVIGMITKPLSQLLAVKKG